VTRFVLVHGSTQNSRGWDRVAQRLRSRGHTVIAPDLPRRSAEWHLEDYAAAIAAHVESSDSVVVAHSFSGVFLPIVASLKPCTVVFLAALIPEPNKSAREQVMEEANMLSPRWAAAGSRWLNPAEHADLAKEFLFHDCDAATLEWALSTIELFDTSKLIAERSPITRFPDVPMMSIVPQHDRTVSPEWMTNAARRLLHIEPIDVNAGHCPHVSQPNIVAELLMQASSGSTRESRRHH
jgi:pimeloyl-ACP methyl ester carboxylesterase